MADPTGPLVHKTPGDLMRGQLPGLPPVAGVLGTLPMASGSVYRVTQLSPNEEEQLQKIGVDTSQGLPSNIGARIQQIVQDSQSYLPPESPNFKPQGKFNPTPLDQLPPERQAQIRAEVAAAQRELAQIEMSQTLGTEPGPPTAIQPAFEAAKQHVELFDDSEPAADATVAQSASNDQTGSTAHPKNCVHCGWDRDVPDDTIVTDKDKLVFLHASLGDIPFEKVYDLFAGGIKLTFRTLTAMELDEIFKAVSKKAEADELPTFNDRWELVHRYRLALQLKRVDRDERTDDFPDGLTGDSNEAAKSFWSRLIPAESTFTPLDWIEKHVKSKVMRNEFIFRAISKECAVFNRLVSKLEVMADSPDFWPSTGASS